METCDEILTAFAFPENGHIHLNQATFAALDILMDEEDLGPRVWELVAICKEIIDDCLLCRVAYDAFLFKNRPHPSQHSLHFAS